MPESALYAIDAELACLGAALTDGQAAKAVAELAPTDWSIDRHQETAAAVRRLILRGEPVDRLSVYLETRTVPKDLAPTASWLVGLEEAMPSAANVRAYVERLRDAAVRRKLRDACLRVAEQAAKSNGTTAQQLCGDLREDITAIEPGDSPFRPDRIPVYTGPEWGEELRCAPPRQGFAVEIPGFSLFSGLVSGDLIVVAGRPGIGKSTLGAQLCVEACLRGKLRTWVVSTEMTRRQWGRWMVAVVAGVTTGALPVPLSEDIVQAWHKAPISITDRGTISIAEIQRLAEKQAGLRLIVVDHIGRIAGGRRDSRALEVGDVARGLKAMAKDLECTVVALCQLNRRVEGAEEKRPRLDDLRDSGEVEQEADAVVFLWTDARDFRQARLACYATVAKNRHGPLGEVRTIFDKAHRQIVAGVIV